jgi:di/tricarboxylate transporter
MSAILCVREILIGVLSLFFLFWGITLLLSAYSLKNPLEFIMLFFSSNIIILISGAGILYAAFRLWRICKEKIRPT